MLRNSDGSSWDCKSRGLRGTEVQLYIYFRYIVYNLIKNNNFNVQEHVHHHQTFEFRVHEIRYIHSISQYLMTVCRLKSLLLRVEEDVESACLLQEEEENCEPTFAHVPWSNLVSLCVDYRLDSLDLTDPDAVSEKVRKTWHRQRFSVMFSLSVKLLV